MFSSYKLKHLIIERLRIYTDAGSAVFLYNLKLFFGYCIGTTCLNGKFFNSRHVYIFGYNGKKFFELSGAESRWRSSANIDCCHGETE